MKTMLLEQLFSSMLCIMLLRPWPWIIVALASLVVFPDISSIQEAFPNISEDKLGQDLAYPAMLTKLPSGLLGIVVASWVQHLCQLFQPI
jgi:hypothetical protein